MVQPSKSLYVIAVLVIGLIFYLAGPFSSGIRSEIKNTITADRRLIRWLEVVAPAQGIRKPARAYGAAAQARVLERMKPLVPFNPFPLGKPASTLERRSPQDPTTDFNEARMSFQEHLNLPLPHTDLRRYKDHRPHNYHPQESRPIFATMLSTRDGSLQDPYFLAVLSLTYRMLWSPTTASKEYPFAVFVPPFVSIQQREVLAGTGAIVREIKSVDWKPNVSGVPGRLRDSFSKLQMWAQIEFPRVAFIDADAFPIKNIDDIFEIAQTQECAASLLTEQEMRIKDNICDYVFAAVKDIGSSKSINAGVMVFRPNGAMHARLLQNFRKQDRYDNSAAEQGFLNWQFAATGPFPTRLLPRKYNGRYPQESDEGRLSVVHEKLWLHNPEDAPWLRGEWSRTWKAMVNLYNGESFARLRKGDDDGSSMRKQQPLAELRQTEEGSPSEPRRRARPDTRLLDDEEPVPASPRRQARLGTHVVDDDEGLEQAAYRDSRRFAEDSRADDGVGVRRPAQRNGQRDELSRARHQPAAKRPIENHGLTSKQQEMIERYKRSGKLPADFAP